MAAKNISAFKKAQNAQGVLLQEQENGFIGIYNAWFPHDNAKIRARLNWCYPLFGKKKSKQMLPWGIGFESREEAKACLQQFLEVLEAEPHEASPQAKPLSFAHEAAASDEADEKISSDE